MRIAGWNVNSIRARLDRLVDYLATRRPDVLCVQETKCQDAQFPYAAIEAAGYRAVHHGQRTYNGVWPSWPGSPSRTRSRACRTALMTRRRG